MSVINKFKKLLSNKVWLILIPGVLTTAIILLLVALKSGESKAGTSPRVEPVTIKAVGTIIEEPGEKPGTDREIPFSSEDSIQTTLNAAEEMKKRSEEKQGKQIIVAKQEVLVATLPQIEKWQMETPAYHKGAYGVHETSNLSARYQGPDSMQVMVEAIDYGTASAALQPLKMIFSMNNSTENKKSYARVSVYNSIPVFEQYDKQKKEAGISFIYKDRYIFHLKCLGKNSLEILKTFIQGFDFSGLE